MEYPDHRVYELNLTPVPYMLVGQLGISWVKLCTASHGYEDSHTRHRDT